VAFGLRHWLLSFTVELMLLTKYIPNEILSAGLFALNMSRRVELLRSVLVETPKSENIEQSKQHQKSCYEVHSFITYAKLSPRRFPANHPLPPVVPLSPSS
jgi:hypothetical protein